MIPKHPDIVDDKTFHCSCCNRLFPVTKSNEDLVKECEQVFGEKVDFNLPPGSDMFPRMVCDDCWLKIIEWDKKKKGEAK